MLERMLDVLLSVPSSNCPHAFLCLCVIQLKICTCQLGRRASMIITRMLATVF